MDRLQWRVLYRQFLFRVFDREMLPAKGEGDAYKLLGQFAALLVFVSAVLSSLAIVAEAPWANGLVRLVVTMIIQHFLIATTMLVVGLFGVLSWDATFPDRRDVLVLGPLPVRARTMFLAKVSAVAAALGLTILLLHSLMGLIWPLVFTARTEPATFPALTLDPTPVALGVADLQASMDRSLRQALTNGELTPGTGLGMTIGVWKRGERRVFTYGAAKPDSLFEIASITKTFTGLMLALMTEQGKVRLDQPVRELLPAGLLAPPVEGQEEITLVDLATHHSGLPGLPGNFRPADRSNPYADYRPQQLYAYLGNHGVAKPPDAMYAYSNLGFGLLGQLLSQRSGTTYGDLLRDLITGPLGMTDTVTDLSDEQQQRFLQGLDPQHRPVHAWEFDALAGAGAIRSTASDMITYLEANLHPEKYPMLARAFALSHRPRDSAEGGLQIGLSWVYTRENGTWWHGGDSAGFQSQSFFNPKADCAAVVLLQRSSLLSADLIAQHILQRLSGEPAISLDTVSVPVTTGFVGVLRSYGVYWFIMAAAGAFVYCAILALQGLTALLLPRRLFLRFSGYLQLAAVCLIVGVYFLQPGFSSVSDFVFGSTGRMIQWLPSYWFLALYQKLNGSMHPALEPLARRAWIGLAAVLCGTPVVYTLSYWRMLGRIVEEPDLVAGSRRWSWWPRFGNQTQTAIGQFSVRTLVRSRQHRLILGFYLGIGLAFTSLLLKGPTNAASNPGYGESAQVWIASIMVIVLATLGTRVAFALPLDLRANWIFRVIGVRGGLQTLAASRRALLLLSVAPVWLVTAVVCLGLSPGRQNAGHILVLGLLGLILADLCLLRFRKIPFTCSWLPGKSYFHMVFLGALGLLIVGRDAAMLERDALQATGSMLVMLALLIVAWVCVRRTVMALTKREEQELRFEEEAPPVVMGLGLDGLMPIKRPETTRTS